MPSLDTFLTSFFNETLASIKASSYEDVKVLSFFEQVSQHFNLMSFRNHFTSKTQFLSQFDLWFHSTINPLHAAKNAEYEPPKFEKDMAHQYVIFLAETSKHWVYGDNLKDNNLLKYYITGFKPLVDKMLPYINKYPDLKSYHERFFLSVYRQASANKKIFNTFLETPNLRESSKDLFFLNQIIEDIYPGIEKDNFLIQLKRLFDNLENKLVLSDVEQKAMLQSIMDFVLKLDEKEPCQVSQFLKETVKSYLSAVYSSDLPSMVNVVTANLPSGAPIEKLTSFISSPSFVDFFASLSFTGAISLTSEKLIDTLKGNEALRRKVVGLFPMQSQNYIEFVSKGNPANLEKKLYSFFNAIKSGFYVKPGNAISNKDFSTLCLTSTEAAQEFQKIAVYLKNQKRNDEQITQAITAFNSFAEKILLQETVAVASSSSKSLKI